MDKTRCIIVILLCIVLIFLFIVYKIIKARLYYTNSLAKVTATCIGNKGQMGNQLFQIAALIGIADRNKSNAVIPLWIKTTPLYELSELKIVDSDNIQMKNTVYSTKLTERQEGFYLPIKLPNIRETYNLDGYFQSYLYFEFCKDKIKRLLKPKQDLLEKAAQMVPECAVLHSIGIHVRRGDYLDSSNINRYTHCSIEYYKKAIEKLQDSYGVNMSIIICSDDISWCMKNLSDKTLPSKKITYSNTNSAILDFCVLYLCQHNIIANSSFSWWASFLKQDNTQSHSIIAPYPWYQLDGQLQHLNSDDIYPPKWIVLDANSGLDYTRKRIRDLSLIGESRINIVKDKDPVYVISLEKSKDRFNVAKQLLNNIGFNVVHFRAIDIKWIEDMGNRDGLKQSGLIESNDTDLDTLGTIGCGLSHMCIYAMSLLQNKSWVMIFEDDITTYINGKDLNKKISEAMNYMDTDWDILYLGKCTDRCDKYEKVLQGLYRTKKALCTHAYIISKSGMQKMLSRALYTGIDSQIVNYLENDSMKGYVFHPSIFIQDIVQWSSSLRNYKQQIHNQNDCMYID
jgi:GR25 family glycosyltransferase involved in LPS biosynthesis